MAYQMLEPVMLGLFNGSVEALSMDVPLLQGEAQMRRSEPFFRYCMGGAMADDRRIGSGMICVIKRGLMWRDAPGAQATRPRI